MKKAVLWLFAILCTLLTGCSDKVNASIGIIGGADAPTAFFIASQIIKPIKPIMIIAIVTAVTVGIILYFKKRK